MLAFWHCTSPQLTCPVDLWWTRSCCRVMQTDGHCSQQGPAPLQTAGVWGGVGAAAGWRSEILPFSHLSQLLLCQRTASPERMWLHTPTAIKQNIPAGHLTEGDVLLTRTHYCTLSSASIGKTTGNYISCLLSDGILHLSLLPALQCICWFRGEQECVQHEAADTTCVVSITSAMHGMWNIHFMEAFVYFFLH